MAVTTVCYGKRKPWKSATEATQFFMEAAANTEGSEQERYITILVGLSQGYGYD